MGHFLRLGRPPRLKYSGHALWTSVWLSVLFMVSYSSSNWLTSLRGDVGKWSFAWEVYIPFIPLMILPYMSIDLFFVVAPFVLVERADRVVFARRISLTLLAAVTCYLLFPMVLVIERPVVEGWLGLIFNPFVAMDKPHNLLPSLHIALCTIVADCYLRRCSGWWRVGLSVWFALIMISTLFTWQHHLVDVLGGAVLGVVALHCVQRESILLPVERNRRVALYYAIGGLVLLVLGWFWRPQGMVLLWPVSSLLLLSLANVWIGPGVFRKRNGTLPWLTWATLWPVLLGQRLSLWWYARQCRPWDAIDDRIWVGKLLTTQQAREAIEQGVVAVIDLTAEFSEASPLLKLPYLNLPVLDLTCPSQQQLEQAMAFIDTHQSQGVVYIHCKIGYSRSAAIAGAWLLKQGHAQDVESVVSKLKAARPQIVIRPEIRRLFERLTGDAD